MIRSFLWRLILQLVNTPKHCCRTSSLLAGLFCKEDYWWGTGLWYNKNSESVAEFMTAGSEFFKRRSHLTWYQARLIPVLLHWFKPPHTFDSLVLMRLVFFFSGVFTAAVVIWGPGGMCPVLGTVQDMLGSAGMTLCWRLTEWSHVSLLLRSALTLGSCGLSGSF